MEPDANEQPGPSLLRKFVVMYLPAVALAVVIWRLKGDAVFIRRGWVDKILILVVSWAIWASAVILFFRVSAAWRVSEDVEALSDEELERAIRKLETEKHRRSSD